MNNIDYGSNTSFARYKRPEPMYPAANMRRKVSLDNFNFDTSYKEQFPKYNNLRNLKYSSQTNRNYHYNQNQNQGVNMPK